MRTSPTVTHTTRTFGANSSPSVWVRLISPAFAAPVRGGARRRPDPAHARDVDDHAPVVLILHDGVRPLREHERRDEIQRHDRGGEARRHRRRVRRRGTAGVVHEHIQTPEALGREPYDGVDLIGLAHVRGDERRRVVADARQCVGLMATADDDVRPRVEEPLGDAASDTATPAGHDDRLAGVVERVPRRVVAHAVTVPDPVPIRSRS